MSVVFIVVVYPANNHSTSTSSKTLKLVWKSKNNFFFWKYITIILILIHDRTLLTFFIFWIIENKVLLLVFLFDSLKKTKDSYFCLVKTFPIIFLIFIDLYSRNLNKENGRLVIFTPLNNCYIKFLRVFIFLNKWSFRSPSLFYFLPFLLLIFLIRRRNFSGFDFCALKFFLQFPSLFISGSCDFFFSKFFLTFPVQ